MKRLGITGSLYSGVRRALGLEPPGTGLQTLPYSTDAPGSESGTLLGCVADNKPVYLYQALRLLQSLRWFGGPSAECDFMVCLVGSADPLYSRQFRDLGAKIRTVRPYSEVSPATNKLRFWQLPELASYQQAVCLDCDTIVVRDPLPPLQGPGLHARMVGLPTVPHDVFIKLFDAFGLKIPEQSYRCALSGEATIVYLNNGVLAMDRPTVDDLVPRWIKFTDALLKSEIMRERKWYIEQASLTLALVESGCPFHLLGNEMNFPFPGLANPWSRTLTRASFTIITTLIRPAESSARDTLWWMRVLMPSTGNCGEPLFCHVRPQCAANLATASASCSQRLPHRTSVSGDSSFLLETNETTRGKQWYGLAFLDFYMAGYGAPWGWSRQRRA